LHLQLQQEIDAAFATGVRKAADVANMRLLRGVYYETLRFHPVSQGMPYRAAEDFEFNGWRVEKGQLVVLSQLPMLFAEQPFRDPNRFEPARCMEPRNEHRKLGAFNPFGLDHRTCAAMGLVELMAMTMVATLLYELDLEMVPADYRLRKVVKPLPAPDRNFRMRARPRQRAAGLAPPKPVSEEVSLAHFPGADAPEVTALLHGARRETFAPGAVIITQGAAADAFYLLESGKVEVVQTDPSGQEERLSVLVAGNYFGEMGLLNNRPRAATVRVLAKGPATAPVLRAEAFRRIIAESDMVSDEIARVMRKRSTANQVHQIMREVSLEKLAQGLPGFTVARFMPAQAIVREGEAADFFYLIHRGEALVTHPVDGRAQAIATLEAGDYFGEVGLIHNVPRTATVLAGEAGVVTLRCDRRTFHSMMSEFGDLATALSKLLDAVRFSP
jgi:CRP-like cAMP-binding protein